MKALLTILTLFFLGSQQNPHEGILITIKKDRRSITYVAENITDKDLDLFFMVKSEGFRRSADRPIIKTIPAKDKVDLIQLIPLKNRRDTVHTYTAIVTKPENNLNITKGDSISLKTNRAAEKVKKKTL
ncbi:hypothetical protein I5168_08480 [Nonlabens sp. SCSIO 43208]|uniref:hypothetical protein n=1 Tax=Nonlabens sp. SCSIO 43208 TaxID=2793009 RepID=UPI003D6B1957